MRRFLLRLSAEFDLIEPARTPSRLKAKVYSALMQQEAEAGRLMSLSEGARSRTKALHL